MAAAQEQRIHGQNMEEGAEDYCCHLLHSAHGELCLAVPLIDVERLGMDFRFHPASYDRSRRLLSRAWCAREVLYVLLARKNTETCVTGL